MKCVCVWLWCERSKSKSIIIIIRNRKRVQRTEWQNKVIINMNRADTAQETTRTNFKTNLNLWCSFVIHVWKHPNHSNNSLLVEPLEGGTIRFVGEEEKKNSEFLLFNFIYFFPIISVLFFLSLYSLAIDCRWHKFVCLLTEQLLLGFQKPNEITPHPSTFNQFFYFLQFAFNFRFVRTRYVSMFWFLILWIFLSSNFLFVGLFGFFRLEICRLTIFNRSFLRFERYRHKNRKQIVQTK